MRERGDGRWLTEQSVVTPIKAWRVYVRCYHAFFGTVFIVRYSDPGSGGFVDEIH